MDSPDIGKGVPEFITPEKREALVTKLGSLLHDEWRAPRLLEDGTYEPRLKKTKDEAWMAAHDGSEVVDIANTPFTELPADWQEENRIAAEVAMNEVIRADSRHTLDDSFIDEASTVVHKNWLERNGAWAPEEQKKAFQDLAEDEKEKDRAQIRKAIEIFKSYN